MLGTEFSSKMNRRALRRLGNSVIIPPPFINHTPNRDFATVFGTWAMLGRECNRRAVPGPGKSFIIPPPFINQKRRLSLRKPPSGQPLGRRGVERLFGGSRGPSPWNAGGLGGAAPQEAGGCRGGAAVAWTIRSLVADSTWQ